MKPPAWLSAVGAPWVDERSRTLNMVVRVNRARLAAEAAVVAFLCAPNPARPVVRVEP